MTTPAPIGKGFYQAQVELLHGPRKLSDFIARAGLGITGIGVPTVITIDYKPGEEVSYDRVKQALDRMVALSDQEATETKILSYRILALNLKCMIANPQGLE